MEVENPDIIIKNKDIKELIDFLESWNWYSDENQEVSDEKGISPEILGYIFEKTMVNFK